MTAAIGYGRRGRGRRTVTLLLAVVVGVAVFLAAIGFRGAGRDDGHRKAVDQQLSDAGAQAPNDDPGPTDLVAGMPAGFARTQDGAVAAASAFAGIGRDVLTMDPLAIEDAIRQVSVSAIADRQASQMAASVRGLREALASGSGPLQYWVAVLAVRVEHFDQDRARVAVWNVGVLSREGIAPPQAGWTTSTFDLVWERDDWRIEAVDEVAGPAPILDDSTTPTNASDLAEELDGYVPLLPGPPAGGER